MAEINLNTFLANIIKRNISDKDKNGELSTQEKRIGDAIFNFSSDVNDFYSKMINGNWGDANEALPDVMDGLEEKAEIANIIADWDTNNNGQINENEIYNDSVFASMKNIFEQNRTNDIFHIEDFQRFTDLIDINNDGEINDTEKQAFGALVAGLAEGELGDDTLDETDKNNIFMALQKAIKGNTLTTEESTAIENMLGADGILAQIINNTTTGSTGSTGSTTYTETWFESILGENVDITVPQEGGVDSQGRVVKYTLNDKEYTVTYNDDTFTTLNSTTHPSGGLASYVEDKYNAAGQLIQKTTNSYDEEGNLQDGGTLINYEYHTNGTKKSETYKLYNGDGEMVNNFIREYDENGNYSLSKVIVDGEWKTVDANGVAKHADGTIYDTTWTEGTTSYSDIKFSEHNGKIVWKTFTMEDGTKVENIQFNDNGDPTIVKYPKINGENSEEITNVLDKNGEIVTTTKVEKTYGANSHYREKTSITNHETNITTTIEDKYDESGNVFEIIEEVFDHNNNSYERRVIKFDSNGNFEIFDGEGNTINSLDYLFSKVNANGDDELTADEVINTYNSTDNKLIKEILSYFTDGEKVTDAFKMACGGRSGIDGYENGNRGLTLNTDDVDLITKNGEVSLDMLKLLERASMFSELYLSNQNIVAVAGGPSSSEEAKERANAWVEAMLDYSKSDETRFSENLNALFVKDIYDSYRGMMGRPPILADVSEGLVYHSIHGQYGQGIKGDLFNGIYNGLLIEDGKVVGFTDLEDTPYLVDLNVPFS